MNSSTKNGYLEIKFNDRNQVDSDKERWRVPTFNRVLSTNTLPFYHDIYQFEIK